MPWGVLALAADGTVAALNPAAEALWGVPATAVLGHAPARVKPAVLPPELVEALTEAAPPAGPYWLPHTQQWITLRTAPAAGGRRWVYWDNVTASQQATLVARQQLAEQQQTRELLAAVEAVGHTGSYEADLPTMTLRFSDGLFRLFGEAPQSFTPSFAFIDSRSHPDDVLVGQGLLARITERQEPYRYLHRISWADGQQRTLEVHASVLRDPAGTPVKLLGLVQDVTERQQAEADVLRGQQSLVRQATNQYQALIEALDQGYLLAEIEFDAQNRAVDILYLDANPAAARIVGQDFTGRRLRDISPAYEAYWYEIFGRVALTGASERLEQYAEPDQKWFDFYVFRPGDEASRRVAVVFQDVTARKRREAHTAFLATVQDDLSLLATPDEILQAVGRKLGDYLHLSACTFLDVDATQEHDLVVSYVWYGDGAPSLQGSYRSSDYLSEEIARASQAGQPTIVRDMQTDGRILAKEAYAQLGIGAFVGFPFHRHGEWKHFMTVTTTAARDWQPEELELLGEVVQRVFPRLERARAEEALRQSEERQAFLLQLSDVLRPLADPAAIQREASRVLRAQLGAGQVVYTEATGPDELLAAATDVGAGIPNQLGFRYHKADFGPAMWAELEAGRTHWRDDVAADPHFSDEEKAVYLALHAPAWANVPLVKNGRLVVMLTAHFPTPHHWTADELRLLEETAERTWAAAERARTEAALRASEDLFQKAFSIATVGQLYFTLDGAVTAANPAFVRMSGYRHEALLALNWEVLTATEFWDITAAAAGELAAHGKTAPYEKQFVRPDGSRWWGLCAPTRLRGHGPAAECMAFIIDISERKQAEEVAQQSEARQAYLLSLSDALRSVEAATDMQATVAHTAMRYFQADRCYYCEIAGDTVTIRHDAARPGLPSVAAEYDLSTMPIFQAMVQAKLPVVVGDVPASTVIDDNLKALCQGFGIVAYINVPVIKHGEQVGMLCLTQGTPREWAALEVALMQETAERTWAAVERAQAEEALRHSEARFRSLFESMNQGFAVCELVRDETGRPIDYQILDINPAGERLTGITRAEFAGRRVREVLPGMEMWWIETFAHVVETGETTRFEHYVKPLDRWRDFTVFAYDDDKFAFIYDDITARKRAEQAEAVTKAWLEEQVEARTQALQASHARLNTIFEAVPLQLGYYEAVRDADGQVVDLRIVAVNRASSDTMALPDVAAGMLMSAQRPGLREQPMWQAMKKVLDTGQPQRLELRHEFGSRTVWFDVQYTRLEDGIISASLDITARKQMEQELRESRERLQSLFDTSLISMSVLQAVRDEAGAIQDFRIAFANKELERETGRTDLVGKLYAQEYPGIKLVGIYDAMLRVMDTGQPAGLEYYYGHEGFDKWFACQFVKADDGLVATNLDITERKLAELEQAKSYQLLRQSEEVASLGSWDYNRATGEFRWSEGMYRLFGLPQGSPIRPETYLTFAVAEDRPVAERIVQGLTTGRTGFEETLRMQVDGAVKTVRVKATVVPDAAGEPLRVLGVDLDISEVQRLEAENLRLRLTQQQALFQAVLGAQETERQRMAESLHNGLGQTLYAVKLQLNQLPATPASAALAQADRLLADAIRQTRTLSHELVPTVLSEFGLAAALRDICRSLGNAKLRFACTVELDDQPPLPKPLQLALYRMSQELAQNVVKHAHATTASLELETVPGYVLLRVEDNGKGFASPPSTAAAGIGLRTIRDQVALLGGTVDVGSSPTFGTYVRLRIPLPTPAIPPA
jgi:PAS domain S-box-containing protein